MALGDRPPSSLQARWADGRGGILLGLSFGVGTRLTNATWALRAAGKHRECRRPSWVGARSQRLPPEPIDLPQEAAESLQPTRAQDPQSPGTDDQDGNGFLPGGSRPASRQQPQPQAEGREEKSSLRWSRAGCPPPLGPRARWSGSVAEKKPAEEKHEETDQGEHCAVGDDAAGIIHGLTLLVTSHTQDRSLQGSKLGR